VATLREVWSRNLVSDSRDAGRELRRRASEMGEPASRALIEILAGHFAQANWDSWSSADLDELHEVEGVLIGELATEATARALLRAVADGGPRWGLRRAFVVALCRARFAFAAEPLADLACDRRVVPELREAILYRFHRLGCAAPACLRDLLYQPYEGLDVIAAATLALCGQPEGDGPAQPHGSTGDQRDALCHVRLLRYPRSSA